MTLDTDAEQIIRHRMSERKVSFKQALNDLLREAGPTGASRRPFATQTHSLGPPQVDLTKALQLAGQLEDTELARRLETGS